VFSSLAGRRSSRAGVNEISIGQSLALEQPTPDELVERRFDAIEGGLFERLEPPARNAADCVGGRGVQRNVVLKLASNVINRTVGWR